MSDTTTVISGANGAFAGSALGVLQLGPVVFSEALLEVPQSLGSLGGTLGTIAVLIHKELLLVILGGVFVLEALSVIVQVISFKTTGKRIFKMSPFHHHLQLSGWNESKIIVRFWIVAIILALLTLTTLKIR